MLLDETLVIYTEWTFSKPLSDNKKDVTSSTDRYPIVPTPLPSSQRNSSPPVAPSNSNNTVSVEKLTMKSETATSGISSEDNVGEKKRATNKKVCEQNAQISS